ncbi:tripartite tricarboxylate transporter permease [Oricola indica]|uniref:tripartite tricarboxylate transporter permease n=1 Tax=Oricola indica TaxID=2872591 RepID=UPI003CCB867D
MSDPGIFLDGIFNIVTLSMLLAGVMTGLVLGIIPGVGGLFGLVMLVPFTYHLDPFAATALLLGVTAVTSISDTIPAVLLGVPGTVAAIATVEDGHPLAKQNQAERALGAAFSASMIGGIFGAVVLAAVIPFLRPIVTTMQMPDFLAVSLMGMLFVALISGRDSFKGLASLCIGVLLAFIGLDNNTGEERFTGGLIYLWDGMPLEILFLGIFGFPEIIDLLQRGRISEGPRRLADNIGLRAGIGDTLRNWRLVFQSSSLGAVLGAIPGVGVTVIDWVAYGLAKRQNRDEPEFGKGNIKGVIAPESANNAKEGGYLIPTIALGLPGSVTMTILLGAFNVQGLVPGPQMLGENVGLIYAMVFFICAANIVGTATCIAFARPFARIATIPTYYIFPVATVFLVLGAFYRNTDPKDILVFVLAGALGYYMKHKGWSRAALSLGFVLGASVERFFFLSLQLHQGWDFFRPTVVIAAAAVLTVTFFGVRKARRIPNEETRAPDTTADFLGYVVLLSLAGLMTFHATELSFVAGLFPTIMGVATILAAATLVARFALDMKTRGAAVWPSGTAQALWRGVRVPASMAAYCVSFFVLILAFGHLAAVAIYVFATFMRHAPKRIVSALVLSLCVATVAYAVFDHLVSVPWPEPWIKQIAELF